MSDERELIAEREKKVEEIRALGANPYANGFAPTHTAADLQAKFAGASPPPAGDGKGAPPALLSDEHFKVAGRIASYRSFGKAAFVKLLDRTGEIGCKLMQEFQRISQVLGSELKEAGYRWQLRKIQQSRFR